MSLTSRIILVTFAMLFGLMLALWASTADDSWFRWLPAAFCFVIAGACAARGRLAQFLGGLIALSVIVAGLAYLFAMLNAGPFYSGPRNDGSWVEAMVFCVLFGSRAVRYLWATRFGFTTASKALDGRSSVDNEGRL